MMKGWSQDQRTYAKRLVKQIAWAYEQMSLIEPGFNSEDRQDRFKMFEMTCDPRLLLDILPAYTVVEVLVFYPGKGRVFEITTPEQRFALESLKAATERMAPVCANRAAELLDFQEPPTPPKHKAAKSKGNSLTGTSTNLPDAAFSDEAEEQEAAPAKGGLFKQTKSAKAPWISLNYKDDIQDASASVLKPYYQDELVRIYHGDCQKLLPLLGKTDLLLTDPPYGIRMDRRAASKANLRKGWKDYGVCSDWDKAPPSKEVFELLLASAQLQVIWGAPYFSNILPMSPGWLQWDKGQRNFSMADAELAWTSFMPVSKSFLYYRGTLNREGRRHPTQKPNPLMKWCIGWADASLGRKVGTILDPFLGSGTTLKAAKELGRRAIGIEREERYCEIAAKRMME